MLRLADLPALRIRKRKPARSYTRRARLARQPAQPSAIELYYTAGLVEILRAQQTLIRRAAKGTPKADRARLDTVASEVSVRIARLRTEFANLLTEDHLFSLLDKVANRIDEKSKRDTARLIGIKLDNVAAFRDFLVDFRRENIQLIRSVSTEQLDRVDAVFVDASAEGDRVETTQARLQDAFEITESRAALIARDQVLKGNAGLTEARHVAAGVVEYDWTTTGDSRVRHDHAALDGKRFAYGSPPVTNAKTGARNPPGMDFQCRCTADPVIDHLL